MTLMSVVEHYFRPPSWYRWMKSLEINWNCNLLLMTFSISLLIMLSRMIGLKSFGESYNSLLGLEIIINIETLKYNGQWPKSIHTSAMLMNFLRYAAFLTILLKCLYNNLSGPGINKLLHFLIELMNFSFEDGFHIIIGLLGISSNKLVSIW